MVARKKYDANLKAKLALEFNNWNEIGSELKRVKTAP